MRDRKTIIKLEFECTTESGNCYYLVQKNECIIPMHESPAAYNAEKWFCPYLKATRAVENLLPSQEGEKK